MTKPHPKTGEPRATAHRLNIDLLPPVVHEAILFLRNQLGKTWQEIEALSVKPAGLSDDAKKAAKDSPKGVMLQGFVPWDTLPTEVLALFPDRRLPHSSLHRWYDLRVEQVQRDVLVRSEQAQVVAKAFAKAGMAKGDEAVINAARDQLMGVLAEDGSQAGRLNATKGLIKLAEVMLKATTNKIRERKVAVDEKALQAKLDEMKRKAGELLKDAVDGKPGEEPISREQVISRVKEIYGLA